MNDTVLTIFYRRHLIFGHSQLLIDDCSVVLIMVIIAVVKATLKAKIKGQPPEPTDSSACADQACSE